MNRILSFLMLLCCCACSRELPNLLPMPQKVEWGKGYAQIEKTALHKAALLDSTFCPESSLEEAYNLRVTKDSIVLYAASELGFLRAEQTLAQLTQNGRVRCCEIWDYPTYEWRGIMLDVSRHFLPIEFLKKHIDILSSYKINRLHLHLTDAAGWRMEIKKYPLLTKVAAWRTKENWKEWWEGDRCYIEEGSDGAFGGYYTQDELRDLVGYAAERGITIVPEIEMPAHSEEVLTVYPELSCTHEPYTQADFCIGNDASFEFLENVLLEVMDIFPSEYIHIGGDEAGKRSWSTCPLCQAKMKRLGLKDLNGLQAHLIEHFGNFLKEHGRKLVGWDEVLDETLTDNSTVMVWRGVNTIQKAAEMGLDVVASPGEYCYIDKYQDDPSSQMEAIGGYLSLEKMYGFNPSEGLTDAQAAHIKGLQANLWAEYIPTQEHREYMLYPRAFAIAEIGWNGTPEKDFKEFRGRALYHTESLRRNGVNAFDLRNEVGDRDKSKSAIKHKAIGAKVLYNLPYHERYVGSGPTTLTDGLHGGWNYGDGRWQGFISGARFDVVVDLGEKMSFSKVLVDFLQICNPDIYFPAEFIVSVSDSDDLESFVELTNQITPVVKTTNPQVKQWKWEGDASGRYIRVQARPGEFSGWIFTDEIEVY